MHNKLFAHPYRWKYNSVPENKGASLFQKFKEKFILNTVTT